MSFNLILDIVLISYLFVKQKERLRRKNTHGSFIPVLTLQIPTLNGAGPREARIWELTLGILQGLQGSDP